MGVLNVEYFDACVKGPGIVRPAIADLAVDDHAGASDAHRLAGGHGILQPELEAGFGHLNDLSFDWFAMSGYIEHNIGWVALKPHLPAAVASRGLIVVCQGAFNYAC
jgi:hypothetical protein